MLAEEQEQLAGTTRKQQLVEEKLREAKEKLRLAEKREERAQEELREEREMRLSGAPSGPFSRGGGSSADSW